MVEKDLTHSGNNVLRWNSNQYQKHLDHIDKYNNSRV